MPKRTAQTTYRANRAALLKDNPTCHWCGRAPATEADHLIEHAAGGSDDLSNLVPACKPCNGRRGQAFRAKRDEIVRNRREMGVFSAEHPLPPTLIPRVCGDNQPETATFQSHGLEPALTGRERPRLETPRLGGQSFGPQVAAWSARYLQVELMPWQIYALDGQLQIRDDGSLAYRESLVSTARQQGKSVALQAMIGWWLTDFAASRNRAMNVLSVANKLDRAEAIFGTLAPVLVEIFGGKQRQQIGRKTVALPTGSVWDIRAAAPSLHGGSYDLIVVDELWNVSAQTVDEALRPSQIARPEPMLSMWSTAGDSSSAAMIDYRENALAEIDRGETTRSYFAEWSMPPGMIDEQFWGYANPALGTTVTIEALRAASGKDGFLRAHLNQWITARGAWLDPGVWETAAADLDVPAGGILAVDSSVDESRYVGIRAAMAGDQVIVDLAFVVDTEAAMWEQVTAAAAADRGLQFAITPTLQIHVPPELNRRFHTVGYGELLRYTSLVRSMIVEGRVKHRGSSLLAEHVNRAVGVRTAQGYVVSTQKSPGPIEACRTAIWAIALVSKPVSKQRPTLAVAG